MAKPHRTRAKPDNGGLATELRIVGGKFRGRKLRYHGDPIVRPMKHRVRESIFNLISTACEGRHALDLFAGTGALGLEALSRGAVRATFIEKHVPTAHVVRENIATLEVEDRTTLHVTSAFLWGKRDLPHWSENESGPEIPWLVFCSPPYAFYTDREGEMLGLIGRILERAPKESIIIVEADEHFDFDLLPATENGSWDIRTYAPAVVGVYA